MEPEKDNWLDASDGPVGTAVCELIKRVERFCTAKGWKTGYFSKQVAGSDTWFERMKETGRVQVWRLLEVESYLDVEEPKLNAEGDE